MEFVYEIVVTLLISYILTAIICTICEIQFKKFLDQINMSKYHTKKKLLLINEEIETNDTKLLDKYTTRIQIYTTIFIFILLFLLNINYHIINL